MSVEVLMSWEQTSMAATWCVYLCLEVTHDGVELTERRYEALAEIAAYEGEDGDSGVALPEFINGKRVTGTEDEWIVGGALQPSGGSIVIRRVPDDIEIARAWLKETRWDRRSEFGAAWKRIEAAVAAGRRAMGAAGAGRRLGDGRVTLRLATPAVTPKTR